MNVFLHIWNILEFFSSIWRFFDIFVNFCCLCVHVGSFPLLLSLLFPPLILSPFIRENPHFSLLFPRWALRSLLNFQFILYFFIYFSFEIHFSRIFIFFHPSPLFRRFLPVSSTLFLQVFHTPGAAGSKRPDADTPPLSLFSHLDTVLSPPGCLP